MDKKPEKTQEKSKIHEEFAEFLEKRDVSLDISIDFPEYKVLPVDLQLALAVISKHTNRFSINFVEKDKE